jgi:N-methyltransferase StaMA
MSAETYSADGVRELYEWFTDLMARTHGGHLHGGYWDGASTVAEAGDRLTEVVAQRCRLVPGQHVLDAGSGNGKATVQVAGRHLVRVSGVTLSGYQVGLAQALADEHELADVVDFSVADMREMPFPDNTFDAAFAIESMCHVPDRTRAFTEIARVLRPGGCAVVTDFELRQPITDPAAVKRVAANVVKFELGPILPRAEYEALVHAAGLEIAEFTDVREQVWPSWQIVTDRLKASRNTVGNRLSDEEFNDLIDALEGFGAITEIGYAVVVARKPA